MTQVFDKNLPVITGKRYTDLINDVIDSSKVVWVRIKDKNSARYGSIGIVTPENETPEERTWNKNTPGLKRIFDEIEHRKKHYYGRDYAYDSFRATIHFGNGKFIKGQNLRNFDPYYGKEMYDWLDNYQGKQFFQFIKGVREIPKKYDMLGKEIKEGDFGVVAYAKYDLRFGTVDRVSPAGAVYVKTFVQSEAQSRYYSEVRLSQGSQFLKISADTYDEAVISKLMFG